jgi:DNA repair protein RecO (recombination protein O)
MLIKDDGIILRTARRGESSLDVIFLGRLSGKIRLIAKGILGKKTAQRLSMEPGNLVEIVYYHKEGRTLYYLKEISFRAAASVDRRSLPALASILAAVELLDMICYSDSPDEVLVDIAVSFMGSQPAADPLFFFLALELKLLEALGAIPDFFNCAGCGEELTTGYFSSKEGACYCKAHKKSAPHRRVIRSDLLRVIDACCRHPLHAVKDMQVDLQLRKDLGKLIHWTYTYHVQGYKLPQSLKLI